MSFNYNKINIVFIFSMVNLVGIDVQIVNYNINIYVEFNNLNRRQIKYGKIPLIPGLV